MASGAGANVVEVIVQATDDTAAGFGSVKAGADETADAMTEYAAASKEAADADTELADAQARLAGLQDDGKASAEQLAAAQDAYSAALDKSVAAANEASSAQVRLAEAQTEAADAAKVSGDAAEESAAKTDESGGLLAGAGEKGKAAFLGLAVGVGYAVDKAMEFQEQSTELVTGAGELDKNLKMVEQGMLDVSSSTATSLTQVQSGMYMIESAGYHGAAGLKVLQAAAEGAKVGNADLGVVANATTTVLTDYRMGADSAASATSGLVATVAAGKTHLSDLSSSLSKVLPTASALKIPFDEVGGAMATMTGQGVTARLAATHLNSTLLAMVKPSTAAAAAMTQVGLSSSQVANTLTHQGLTAALEQVTDAAGKKFPVGSAAYVSAVDTMLGGQAGLSTALQLTGDHLSTLKANTESVAKSMKDGSKDVQGWAEVQQDASFKLKKTEVSAQDAAVAFGDALLPAVEDVLGPISSFAEFLAHSTAASTALAVVVGGALSLYLGSKLVSAFSEVKSAGETMMQTVSAIAGKLGILRTATEAQTEATEAETAASEEADAAMSINPVMLIIAAIALLVIGIVELIKHWSAVENAAKVAWKAITGAVSEAFDWIKGHWPLLLAILTGPIGAATLFIVDHWKQILSGAEAMLNGVVSFFRGLPGRIVGALSELASDMFNAGVHAIEGLINGVKSMIGSVGDIMGDVGHAAEGALKSVLGIFSPSTVMAQHGQMIVEGLAQGIASTQPRVLNAMRDMGASLMAAGKSAVTGLVNGMRSMMSELTTVVQELANEADDAIKSRMEISSPSKVMYRHGQAIAEGLGAGMLSGKSAVSSAARQLAGSAGPSTSGGGSGGAAGAGTPLNIVFQPGGGSGLEAQFWTWLKNGIRTQGGDPRIINKKVQFL